MNKKDLSIGFFDSGLGGLSVLQDAIKILPHENYIYFGDSINAPYGDKSFSQVWELTYKNVQFLQNQGVKAIVIACNTATSVAINKLRSRFDIPIIGMEPAIKPAANIKNEDGKILLLATKMTLQENKLKDLVGDLDLHDHLIKVAASEMVILIESGNFTITQARRVVEKYLAGYDFSKIDCIVLGCTHFVFYKQIIAEVVNHRSKIIDGNWGTVKNLKSRLQNLDLLKKESNQTQKIKFYNSDKNISEEQCRKILKNSEF
ncbi:MAG: glutamate racemase [Candidatus Marinimicrobia bacterium]|nr:glutamate racemase [Candidatus Neomarinimicrobiota bacterium]